MTGWQQEKSIKTRNELMAAAVTLFGEKGFVAATISDITKCAGYAKGNFYRYWKSKDDIFLSIMKERLHGYRQARKEALEKAETMEEVVGVILDFLESIIDDENWSKIFLEFTIHASRSEGLKKELSKGEYRLSNDLFAELIEPYITSSYTPQKIGALSTAIFEGFLIHNILGTGVLTKEDMRKAILTVALAEAKTGVE